MRLEGEWARGASVVVAGKLMQAANTHTRMIFLRETVWLDATVGSFVQARPLSGAQIGQ